MATTQIVPQLVQLEPWLLMASGFCVSAAQNALGGSFRARWSRTVEGGQGRRRDDIRSSMHPHGLDRASAVGESPHVREIGREQELENPLPRTSCDPRCCAGRPRWSQTLPWHRWSTGRDPRDGRAARLRQGLREPLGRRGEMALGNRRPAPLADADANNRTPGSLDYRDLS